LLSCSNDDNNGVSLDPETSISMKINGVEYDFQNTGYGIDLVQGGHKLTLWMMSYDNPYKDIIISLKFKKKGKNVIDVISYTSYEEQIVDLQSISLTDEVFVNSQNGFKAEFEAVFQNGEELIIISEGKINVVYDEPLIDFEIN